MRERGGGSDAEYEKLKKSILEFGYVDPIIWNARTGNVIGGHQRLKVLMQSGETELDCVVLDLEETREKALNLALNKISGEWDIPLLKDLLQNLENNNFDVELVGFDKLELDTLFERAPYIIQDDNFDEDKAVAEVAEPITKEGDVWQLGKHRLICGDCTDKAVVAKLMGGAVADLIVTDPPYNVDYNNIETFRAESAGRSCKHSAMANDKMQDNDFYNFLVRFYQNAYESLKGGGAIVEN